MLDNFMDQFDPKEEKFKALFWEWFDALSRKKKEKFWNFSVDMAMIFYYNKYYRYKK